jgi:hypothetical protein
MSQLLPFIMFCAFTLPLCADDGTGKTAERIEAIRSDAMDKRFRANEKIDREYRVALATTFELADRVEVFLLDLAIGRDGAYLPNRDDDVFPILPYNKETKILKTLQVPPNDVPKWCAAVKKLITSEKLGGGDLCHFPIHGLRIYAHDKLRFETSICWHCGNYTFNYQDNSHFVGLTEDAVDLKKLLDQFMPIPESELQRFPGAETKSK